MGIISFDNILLLLGLINVPMKEMLCTFLNELFTGSMLHVSCYVYCDVIVGLLAV